MTETKTSAQLRQELAELEWKEYQAARRIRQAERVMLLTERIKAKQAELADAQKRLAQIDAEIKSGVVGIVPRPGIGGVSVVVPTANLGVRGN